MSRRANDIARASVAHSAENIRGEIEKRCEGERDERTGGRQESEEGVRWRISDNYSEA